MSTIKEPGQSAPVTNSQRAGRAQDGRKAAQLDREWYYLKNSTVIIEPGLTGSLARVVRRDGVEYAGPLTEATIEALAEVADGGY